MLVGEVLRRLPGPAIRRRSSAAGVALVVAAVFAVLDALLEGPGFADPDFFLRLAVIFAAALVAVGTVQARERLRITEAQLSTALGGLAEAVTVQTADGRLVYANEAAANMLGFPSGQDLAATPTADIVGAFRSFTEDGRPLDLEMLPGRRLLRGEVPEPLTVRAVNRQTGEERWSVTKASAVRDRHGRVRMAVNVIEDITEVKRAETAQWMLAQSGAVLASSLDYESTLGQVARMAVPELADWCAVSLPDERRGVARPVAIAHVDPEKVAFGKEYYRRFPARLDAPAGVPAVLRDGRPELYPEVTDEQISAAIADPEQRQLLRQLGLRSVMIVPMVAAGRTIGAISFVTAESGRAFGDADLALAQELGRRAGTAVENARLYTERSHIARTLQAGLLPPRLPEIGGFQTATLYRPAGAENWVGGDFYDAFPTSEGWMVVVGDVVGRGAEAAAVTALARYTLRTAGRLLDSPLEAVHELNRELLERATEGVALCTVCLVLLRETHDGEAEAEVVSTGHPPPLLVRDAQARRIEALGAMLGVESEQHWEPARITLAAGDLLVLYTDGVLEIRGADDRFGEDRLAATVAQATGAHDAVQRIKTALESFGSGSDADDTAVVAVSRAPVAAAPGARRARARQAQ